MIEQQRVRLAPTDAMKREVSCNFLFNLAIQLHYEAGKGAEALEIAEQARARAFLDLLATREIELKPDPQLKSSVTAAPFSIAELTDTLAGCDPQFWPIG